MIDTKKFPEAPATLVTFPKNYHRTSGHNLWEVTCPFCKPKRGKPIIHIHGAGNNEKSPDAGHRLPHCMKENVKPEFLETFERGYIITWDGISRKAGKND